MKTKKIKVCNAIHLSVACIENDSVDIRAGGPAILGYDFYISPDMNLEKVERKIRKWIDKYDRPFIGISGKERKDTNVKHLWNLKGIKKCIKDNGIW